MTDCLTISVMNSIRQRMNHTGIGYAGIGGAWWLPAVEPFVLPMQVEHDLAEIGQAIFLLFDIVTTLYGTAEGAACGLNQLLEHKVPPHIPRLQSSRRVELVRPDFQLCLRVDGQGYQLVATELEICPSAQGFAHAMQVGYGLHTDLVGMFAHYLAGRPLLFVGTEQWSEFLFEQLAFCHALAEVGAQGYVLFDLPIQTIADEVRAGQRWQLPMFGIHTKPSSWDDDVLGRIHRHGLERYLWPDDAAWPDTVDEAVVFRFGYFDCFAPEKLQQFVRWQEQGATLLNPALFILDSKVILAALAVPAVRQRIAVADANALAVLDCCVPETILLDADCVPRLEQKQDDWVIKFAGFDRSNQAWGGRSLQIGAHHTAGSWRHTLEQYVQLPWPVVAQRVTPSARVDIAYLGGGNQTHWMRQGFTRLRSFLLRDPRQPASVLIGGSHLTIVADTAKVAESITAVQAPIIFQR